MNKKGVGFGIFLLGLGLVWLLVNFNLINFNVFCSILTLWPLVFVVIGINMIFKNNGLIRGATWLIFLLILIIYGSFNPNTRIGSFNWNWDFNNNNSTTSRYIDEAISTGLKNGNLKINAGAIQLNVSEEKEKLILADVSEGGFRYDIDYNNSGDSVNINVDNKNTKIFGSKMNSKLDVKLNNQVVWDLKLDTGASNGDIDLSNVKVKSLDIDSGAVSYKIKLGGNVPVTDIKLDSGASKFDFDIPSDDVGVRVKVDGGFNNTNLQELGWTKKASTYESPNYSTAKSKINIDADIGAAKLTINYN